jgi:hypothetical protein
MLIATRRELAEVVIDGRQWPEQPASLTQSALHHWLDQARAMGVQWADA